mmetsp:Transcript_7566/g.32005  ORF Transcript_7566/g.32005 Transcript_7566/m.32005 type:complete len:225 (-) Transcript_7566:273-947(-)
MPSSGHCDEYAAHTPSCAPASDDSSATNEKPWFSASTETVPAGDSSVTSRSLARRCAAERTSCTCSSGPTSAVMRKVSSSPSPVPSGSAWVSVSHCEAVAASRGYASHSRASSTAAAVSRRPKPYLWFTCSPAPLYVQSGSVRSTMRAVLARRCCTSRQPSNGLVSRRRATAPATTGVALLVPPNASVQSSGEAPAEPVRSTVVMPRSLPEEGAEMSIAAPGSL